MPNLTLPLPPSANRIWKHWGGKTVIAPEYSRFKSAVRTLATLHGVCDPLEGPVSVAIAYHPKARKKETEKPLRRLDVDGPIKATLDSFIGIAYLDDYQVVSIRCDLAEPVQDGKLVVMWEAAA